MFLKLGFSPLIRTRRIERIDGYPALSLERKAVMKQLFVIVISVFITLNLNSFVEASCGASNCTLITGSQSGLANEGRFVVDLSYRYIPQDKGKKGSSDFSGPIDVAAIDFANGTIEPEHHREIRTINQLAQLDISYGVTEKFTLSMNIPFFNDRYHEHIDGIGTPMPEFTNQDGSTGFGDITLMTKYAVWQTTKHLLIAGAGVKFPTGEYKLLNSEGEINEPTIMPGTGSTDPVISLLYNFSLVPNKWDFFASVAHRFTTENSLDYEFGDSTLIDGGVIYRLNEKINLLAQINTRISGRDKFLGMDVPNTGVTFVNLTPGVVLTASESTAFYAHVQIPIYQYVNEVNLVPNWGLIMGISYGF